MTSTTTTVSFTGTVLSCGTRFSTEFERAFVTHFHANWVVTISIEDAEPNAPAGPGETASFLFHSPTHLFLADAKQVIGWRCKFTIDRIVKGARVSWFALTAQRLPP